MKIGETFASFQLSGSFPVSKDLWKISCRIGAYSLCKVCRTMSLNLSGPAALCGFKPTSSLSVPSAAMLISGILGLGLGLIGGFAPESCKSCSDFWARDFKFIGVLGLTLTETGHLRHLLFLLCKRVCTSFLNGAIPLTSSPAWST